MRISDLSLQQRCLNAVMPLDRERGARYFNRRRVSLGARQAAGISATVEGSESAVYQVRLDWSEAESMNLLEVRCSCPRFADLVVCKHVWATMIAVDAAHFAEPVPGTGRLELELVTAGAAHASSRERVASYHDPEAHRIGPPGLPRRVDSVPPEAGRRDELGFFIDTLPARRREPSLPAPRREPPLPAPRREPPLPVWRRQLGSIRSALADEHLTGHQTPWPEPREVLYRINVARCFELDELAIDLYQRKTGRDGELGQPKRLNLIHESPENFAGADDRELLAFFKASPSADFDAYAARYRASYAQTRGRVPAILYDTLLPRLVATGRFGWVRDHHSDPARATALGWDGGEPWRFALVLEQEPQAGAARVHGQLRRGEDSRPLAEPILLLANGLVMWRDRVARLVAADDFPWISQLRHEGDIVVPEAELDVLLEEISGLPELPALEMPKEWRWGEARPAPRPRLALRPAERRRSTRGRRSPGHSPPPRSGSSLEGDVSFDYEGCLVPARRRQSQAFDRRRRRVVYRDRAAEEAAFRRLRSLGMRPPAGYPFDRCDVQLSEQVFREAVGPLIAEGWWVEAQGRKVRPGGGVSFSLTSGVDWFELRGDVDFDGIRVELPRLLEAVRGGETMIRLDDGSQGMLPEDWLERFSPLARLAHGDAGGAVRYQPSQASLLDALLAAEPAVDVDRAFDRLRERLRSFDRVESAPEPRGFHGRLRAYQRDGLGWLKFLQGLELGGCLADDMGLGKTVQVLALLQARRLGRAGAGRPSLIVAPRSVVHNWIEEAARFTPRLAATVYSGPRRKQLLPELGQWNVTPKGGKRNTAPKGCKWNLVVTTYGLLRRDVTALREVDFDYLVLDEAQAIKNASSLGAKAARLLRGSHRLALTGTPVENHLGELWSIFEFLNPGMLGGLPAFKGLTRGRSRDAAAPEGDKALAAVAAAIKPFILRRNKDQVLDDLPEKTEQTLYCSLGSGQWKLYRELRDHYRAALDKRIESQGLARNKIHVLEALLRLRQAACHPGLVDPARSRHKSAKLDVLLEQLDEVLEEGHKALVFSQFVSLLEIVKKRLDRRKTARGKTVYEYLDGRTRDRKRRIDRFQTDPKCRLFLISLKAGGLGLNLTAASYVFILDPWWNPAVEAQAVDRAHRIGQTRPVFAYRLIASGTVEEKILELQQSKRELADAILSASGSMIQNLTAEDLRLLLS